MQLYPILSFLVFPINKTVIAFGKLQNSREKKWKMFALSTKAENLRYLKAHTHYEFADV